MKKIKENNEVSNNLKRARLRLEFAKVASKDELLKNMEYILRV